MKRKEWYVQWASRNSRASKLDEMMDFRFLDFTIEQVEIKTFVRLQCTVIRKSMVVYCGVLRIASHLLLGLYTN